MGGETVAVLKTFQAERIKTIEKVTWITTGNRTKSPIA